jgi:hypothetical protein
MADDQVAREYAVTGNPNLLVHETLVQMEASSIMDTLALAQLTPLSDQEFEAQMTTTMQNFEGIFDFPEKELNERDVREICRFIIRDGIQGSLIRLNLGQNKIGNESARQLAAAIISQSNIREFSFTATGLGMKGQRLFLVQSDIFLCCKILHSTTMILRTTVQQPSLKQCYT